MLTRIVSVRDRAMFRWNSFTGLTTDGFLYGLSAIFALVLGLTSSQSAQWQWGYLTFIPYALAAVFALLLGHQVVKRQNIVRLVLLVIVIFGAVIIPLGLETHWRSQNGGHGDAQPEVGVIARSGELLAKGKDPYHAYDRHGHVYGTIKGLPTFESFFPYFPLMGIFGLPSADTHKGDMGEGLTDVRIVMTLMTLLASGLALSLLRLSRKQKLRVAQVMIALPSGALFLATGGDDMPILALLLLGVAALQRRQSNVAGVSLGIAAAMKLTAWPLALGALLVTRNKEGRSTWVRVLLWVASIVIVTTVPFAIRNPFAFISNVFEFPLGLAGVSSPAASALPGHILTTWFPVLGHVLAPVAFLIGGYFAARYINSRWPLSLSQLLALLSVTFTVLMCVASATRVGYVIYPLNFALWSTFTREAKVPTLELVTVAS